MSPASPAAGTLGAQAVERAREWLAPARARLGPEFLAAYVTGSALDPSFDPKHSHVNLLVVAHSLPAAELDALASALPRGGKPAVAPLFVTRAEIECSLDAFPIEWIEVRERHVRLEGEDLFASLAISPSALRLQCERELRGRHLRLREARLLAHGDTARLAAALRASASGFAALLRTVLRLRGEPVTFERDDAARRVAATYGLDAEALLVPQRLRASRSNPDRAGIHRHYAEFLEQLERLIVAIDSLPAA